MNSRTPILVGSAQYVDRRLANLDSLSPTDISHFVAKKAIEDCSKSPEFRQSIDILVSARLFEDSVKGVPMWPNPYGGPDNVPGAVAKRLEINPKNLVYAEVGGETPQRLVNQIAEKIFEGEISTALLTGSEALLTIRSGQRAGLEFDWSEEIGGSFDDLWPLNPMSNDYEMRHGITFPVQVYALFEQVRRKRLGLSLGEYRRSMSELLAPFSEVASNNPYAQFPEARAVDFIANWSEENFPVCEPYLKWMVAQDAVNQGAAVVITSVAKAIEFGIPESQWIFLKAYSDYDELLVTDRPDLSRSPAQDLALSSALDRSGLNVKDLSFIDLYSCFPIAVWTAIESLGLSEESNISLTVTGGLPFFGGPGNNYSLHAIAEVVRLLRDRGRNKNALVAANGGYLSKHSVGIYSTSLDEGWATNPSKYTAYPKQDAVAVVQKASGTALIESYAGVYKRAKRNNGFIVGRLNETGERFLAMPNPESSHALAMLFDADPIGKEVTVKSCDSGLNFFSLK